MKISLTFIIYSIAIFAFVGALVWAALSHLEQRYKAKKKAHIS
ncbi:hypothetical protein UFOVP136_49 [uncultured Caudovirales phage]|uniref:Uncharacterized protein n=1 Tax=uncultured Caudovirales phage TaxID=2100421 RepID=A0A6J5LGS2_9CAUD|nr:hypothetical protein UFOVP136_49 [uncultured Caudovirales phage]